MTPDSHRPAPLFVGESPALDFLNSIASPKGTIIDWLDTESGLLDWLVEAGLCQNEELVFLRDGSQDDEQAIAIQKVHELRDNFREFVVATARCDGMQLTDPFIAKINDILRHGTLTMQISPPQGDQYALDSATKTIALTAKYEIRRLLDVLPRIAEACAKFICEADFTCVRNCEGPTCTMYFHDVSKNRKRRWCSMSICGNRAKAAAHRKSIATSSQA